MCGITGYFGDSPPSRLQEMVQSLNHRGPDESGSWVDVNVGLGLARLAIVDVPHGHQPVFSQNRSIVAICNGEIYNHRKLRDCLMAQGFIIESRSDVEVIPHLYEIYGLDFVRHLRGMFAIALWDRSKRRLVLARDRAGKKPLWYVHERGRVIFGSEYRAIKAAGWNSPVSLAVLDHVMAYGYVPMGKGAFQDLQSVGPGHVVTFEGGTVRNRQYWSWKASPPECEGGFLEECLEEALKEAVRIRIPNERPFGTFLSGGIDSALVTALAMEEHGQPVRTFTVGFDSPAFDESAHAKKVADYLGTHHTAFVADPDPTEFLPYLARSFDQPLADSSAVPTLLVSALASEYVTVALSGDGGDEVFAGYNRYAASPQLQRLNPLFQFLPFGSERLANVFRRRGHRSVARIAEQMRFTPDLGTRYSNVMQLVPRLLRQELWTKEILAQIELDSAEGSFLADWNAIDEASPISHMQAMDFRSYLPGDLLVKVDIASMAHSLEVRSPLLDQEVVALASRIPPQQLIHGRTTKRVLRQILAKRMPLELFERPKMGFGIPRAEWLRGSWHEVVHDVLVSPTTRERGWFDVGRIEKLLTEHDRGIDRDNAIWPLLMIEMWAREWVDSPA